MEISLRLLFQGCNPSKFVVYFMLLAFTLLFALKIDNFIDAPYWIVFLPLFAWKLLLMLGTIVGCISHCKYPPGRNELFLELEFRSMILMFGENMLLLTFEVMVCFKLQSDLPMLWILIFIPLLLESLIAILICIWLLRRERSFEFELFFAVNIVQFVFLALKLDGMVNWTWMVVFIPFWILICLVLIGVLYAAVLAVLLIRSIDLMPEYRRQYVYSAIGCAFLVVPTVIFLVLLSNKLDGDSSLPYVLTSLPLYISLICLIFTSFASGGGNQWWFGMRRDFFELLLDTCPCLREYGNVSYNLRKNEAASRHDEILDVERCSSRYSRELRPVVPLISIEQPD
ncbi:unnamed protein product [Soboliphyme baturini]|uniref:Transmembrane protein 185A n=1 Tax=Soboliphyme baturini TaxID=241478 RepID=A0A183IEK3_9BILA|nr:unnamed protein product [Soboliphyme baturini]